MRQRHGFEKVGGIEAVQDAQRIPGLRVPPTQEQHTLGFLPLPLLRAVREAPELVRGNVLGLGEHGGHGGVEPVEGPEVHGGHRGGEALAAAQRLLPRAAAESRPWRGYAGHVYKTFTKIR